MRASLLSILALLALLAVPACGDDGGSSCTKGTALCGCVDNACPGGSDLACVNDMCIAPGCDIGAEDCYCQSNGTCDTGLVCDGASDQCKSPAAVCTAGQEGCPCGTGDRCGINARGEELACQDSMCVATSCSPGDAGCTCIGGLTCVEGATCEGYSFPRPIFCGCVDSECQWFSQR